MAEHQLPKLNTGVRFPSPAPRGLGEIGPRVVATASSYRLHRLARDLVVQEQLLAEVRRLGGEVLSTASGEQDLRDDPEHPSRRMIRQILGSVAEYERSMIVLRLKRGRAAKVGGAGTPTGRPRSALRRSPARLLGHDRELGTVQRIKKLHHLASDCARSRMSSTPKGAPASVVVAGTCKPWRGSSLRPVEHPLAAGADHLALARQDGWTDGSPAVFGYIYEVDRFGKDNPLRGIGL